VIAEFEEPKLSIATDDWRGGGMPGPVKIDKGLEAMEATLTMGGHTAGLIRTFGTTDVAGVPCDWSAPIRPTTAPAQSVEIYLGGRFTEIDLGKAKAGDDTEHKYKVAVAYYRRVVDGVEEVEIDMLAGVFRAGTTVVCRDHGDPDRLTDRPSRVRFLIRFGDSEDILRIATE
jgi:P2 family phage contractile tail tube protein